MNDVASLFVDTNILVYARDRSESVKGPFADNLLQEIFTTGQPLVSAQVLSEFFWTVTRKRPIPLTTNEAIAETRRLFAITSVMPVTSQLVDRDLETVATHGMPLWDAQIFAAAKLHHATIVLSEDFEHRRVIDDVTFLNPFAADFDRSEILRS